MDYGNYFLSQDIYVGLATTANSEKTGAATLTKVEITGTDEEFLPVFQ